MCILKVKTPLISPKLYSTLPGGEGETLVQKKCKKENIQNIQNGMVKNFAAFNC
jgi:hypothetical protein